MLKSPHAANSASETVRNCRRWVQNPHSISVILLPSLSILLPVYNWPVGELVTALQQQATAEPEFRVEILVFDDASPDPALRAANRAALAVLPDVYYEELPQNVGRAAIRNYLARAARYSWLLFLDADSGLPDDRFLRRYRWAVATAPGIVAWVGGTAYHAVPPTDPAQRLRWIYGCAREQRPVRERQRAPYAAFTLNNLLIQADTFGRFGLDESLGRTYGHEDTALGGALAVAELAIGHLHNPVLHLGLDSAPVFCQKTAEAVTNLVRLARAGQPGVQASALWRLAALLQRLGLADAVCRRLTAAEPRLLRNLDSAAPSLLGFDAWRLLLVLRAMAE